MQWLEFKAAKNTKTQIVMMSRRLDMHETNTLSCQWEACSWQLCHIWEALHQGPLQTLLQIDSLTQGPSLDDHDKGDYS